MTYLLFLKIQTVGDNHNHRDNRLYYLPGLERASPDVRIITLRLGQGFKVTPGSFR